MAEMTTTKIILKSTLSTQDAKFTTLDFKNMYLQKLLDPFEYMKIPYNLIPDKIKLQYNIPILKHNWWAFVKTQKAMYSLLREGMLIHKKNCPKY